MAVVPAIANSASSPGEVVSYRGIQSHAFTAVAGDQNAAVAVVTFQTAEYTERQILMIIAFGVRISNDVENADIDTEADEFFAPESCSERCADVLCQYCSCNLSNLCSCKISGVVKPKAYFIEPFAQGTKPWL